MELPAGTDAFRLIDGADYTVDVFNAVAILSVYRDYRLEEEVAIAQQLANAVLRLASGQAPLRAVYLKRRPRQAHREASASPEQVAPPRPIWGEPIETIEVREGGARFEIRPANGLSVGLYLDARDARAWVRGHAKGLTVLNLFAYTCGFGVSALLGGATRAVNVDLSRKVLDWGERNAALNGFAPDRRDFIAGDCFEWLGRFAKKGERFGLVVVDPPSFSNTAGHRFRAEKDYVRLIDAAKRVIAPGGILLACCNLEGLGASQFEREVLLGLGGKGKKLAELGASPVDFAQPPALKVLALQT